MTEKLLVITAEDARSFDYQDDKAKWECDAVTWQQVRAAMTEVDADGLPKTFADKYWLQSCCMRDTLVEECGKLFVKCLLAHIKEGSND